MKLFIFRNYHPHWHQEIVIIAEDRKDARRVMEERLAEAGRSSAERRTREDGRNDLLRRIFSWLDANGEPRRCGCSTKEDGEFRIEERDLVRGVAFLTP